MEISTTKLQIVWQMKVGKNKLYFYLYTINKNMLEPHPLRELTPEEWKLYWLNILKYKTKK